MEVSVNCWLIITFGGESSCSALLSSGTAPALPRRRSFFTRLSSWTALVVGTEEQIEAEQRRYISKKLFYGGAVNPRDSDLAITESEDGKSLIFNGKKAFSTGSKISDLTVLEGVLPVSFDSQSKFFWL